MPVHFSCIASLNTHNTLLDPAWGKVRGNITGIETGRHGIKVGSGMTNTNKRKERSFDTGHQSAVLQIDSKHLPPSASSVPETATPQCSFCDGERVVPNLDLVVPQTGGNTCRSIKKMADGEMRGSATCAILQKEERVCCPVVYENALPPVEPISVSNQNDEQSNLLVPFKEGDHVVYDKRNELRLAQIVDVVHEKSKITLKYFKPHSSTGSEETVEYREGLLHVHSEALRFQTGTFANCAFDYVENNTLHFTKANDKSANVSCKRIRFAAEAGSFVGKSGVIVGVLSTSENFRWRNVIRSTWAAENTVFFVIAGSWDDIEEEYHRYKDIIWIDMEDSFRLITYKTSMFFQVVNMMASELNLTYSHALKTDDDSYVAIGRLEQLVTEEKPTTIDYWGYSDMKYVKPLRNLKSRYYVSLDQYPEPYYPPYVAGAAILLSHKTVECVTDEMQNARFLDMEDAFIGIVTARCGVIPTHSELVKVYRGSVGLSRWTTTGNKTLQVTMKGKIIQHRILNPEDMIAHHESIKTSLANTNERKRHHESKFDLPQPQQNDDRSKTQRNFLGETTSHEAGGAEATSSACIFCKTLNEPELVVAGTGGNTCRSIQVLAAKEVNGSDICATIQKEERVCCPGPESVLHHDTVPVTDKNTVTVRQQQNPRTRPACGILVTSQGGVGSSSYLRQLTKYVKTNRPGNTDGLKHKAASCYKSHNSSSISTANGRCFSKVLVIIGDPLHTIER